MQWTKPEFREISLGGELTAYVNTDDAVRAADERAAQNESQRAAPEPHEARA